MTSLTWRALAPVTASIALVAATVAWAAPDRSADLSAATTSYSWDGGPVTGTPVNDVEVDYTLVKVADAGTLDVTIKEASLEEADLDLEVYRADAAGEPSGDPLAEAANGGSDEQVSVKNLKPGTYLIRVIGWLAVETTFKGEAKLKPSTVITTPAAGPEEPPVQVQTDDTPVAAIGKLAKKAKPKKLKGFKGTASDDKGVARVEVALMHRKGSKCRQLTTGGGWAKAEKCDAPTSFLAAAGTTSWSFKLAKKLAKGDYTVFAQAVDSAGQKQAGFGPTNKKAFKIG
jgi:hypothetical protein